MYNRIWYRAAVVGVAAGLLGVSISACAGSTNTGVIMQPVSGPALDFSESFTFRTITDIDKTGKIDYSERLPELGYTYIDSLTRLKEYCVDDVLSLKRGNKDECYIFTKLGLFDAIATGMTEASMEAAENESPKLVYAEDSYLYNALSLDYSHYYSNGVSVFKIKKIQDIVTKEENFSVYAIYYLSFQSAAQCEKVAGKIEEICSDFSGDDETMAKQAYDYLKKHTNYSEGDADRTAFSAYGALYNYRAICEGYAKTYKLMMDCLGIENEIVRSSNHAWNVVKVNGQWYAVDVTNGSYNDCDIYFMMNQNILYSKKGVTLDGYHMTKEHIASYGYIDGTNTGNVSLGK